MEQPVLTILYNQLTTQLGYLLEEVEEELQNNYSDDIHELYDSLDQIDNNLYILFNEDPDNEMVLLRETSDNVVRQIPYLMYLDQDFLHTYYNFITIQMHDYPFLQRYAVRLADALGIRISRHPELRTSASAA